MTVPGADEDLEGARLVVEIEEAVRRERARLSDALHDDALQRLAAVRQDLHEVADGLPEALAAAADGVDDAIAALRGLVRTTADPVVEGLGLETAIDLLARDAARRGRFDPEVRVEGHASGDHDPVILGIVRELLANVAKHAQAQRAWVEVRVEAGQVVVVVSDDGRGVEPDALAQAALRGHVGHARLRRTLDALGGTVRMSERPGGGTVVTVRAGLGRLGAQRTLQDALARERRWSAALVAAVQDGFVVLGPAGAVEVNDRFCAMTGFSRDEILAAPRGDEPYIPVHERGRIDGNVRPDGAIDVESELLRADGTRFPVLLSGRAVLGERGEVVGLMVTAKDISARAAEEERRQVERERDSARATADRLRGLLVAQRAVNTAADVDGLLEAVAMVLRDALGYGAVVVNRHRLASDDLAVVVTLGLDEEGARMLEGATYTWEEWESGLDPAYERRGAYFIPEGAVDWTTTRGGPRYAPAWVPRSHAEAWRAGDELFVPMPALDGRVLGIVSLGLPGSGLRPTDDEIDVLVAICSHAGAAVGQALDRVTQAADQVAGERLLAAAASITGTSAPLEILQAAADALEVALGARWVIAEPVGDGPRASAGEPAVRPDELTALLPDALDRLLAAVDGPAALLLTRQEARDLLPDARSVLLTDGVGGQGPHAWRDHLLAVPLRARGGTPVGVLWAGAPADDLLPTATRLRLIGRFASRVAQAMATACDRSDG